MAGFLSIFAHTYKDGWIVVRDFPLRVEVVYCSHPDGGTINRHIGQTSGDYRRERALRDAKFLIRMERRAQRKGTEERKASR